MKTLRFFLTSVMMLMALCVTNAQSNNDFFAGKWQFEVTGMPQGDQTMVLTLKRGDDGNLSGSIIRGEGEAPIELTRVDEKKDKSLTAYFKSSGYDCYIYFEKTGDDEVEGSVMDMFDAVGKKIKE